MLPVFIHVKETLMKRITLTAVLSGLTFCAGNALAAPALDGAKLYQEKTCLACHGKDAKTPLIPNYPKLAGQNAAYLEEQMKDIKTGARANGQSAAMKGVMTIVNEAEIKAIAEYVSKLK